jgi:hypothetical protein
MNKKTLIKLLAFVAGLYFVLEFLLPEKVGGDFDQFEVRSPAAVRLPDGSYDVWYVGVYRRGNSAVGLLCLDATRAQATRRPEPVLRRGVFNEYDQKGFAGLDAIRRAGGFDLFYLGRMLDETLALCRAASADGHEWTKTGPVQLLLDGADRQFAISPGRTPEAGITATAVAEVNRELTVFVARRALGGVNAILRGQSQDGQSWSLAGKPLELEGFLVGAETQALAALPDDADVLLWVKQSGDPLRLYRVPPDGAPKLLGSVDLPAEVATLSVVREDDGYRAWLGMARKLDTPPTPESSREQTWIAQAASPDGLDWSIERGADQPVAALGRMGQPTYLSRALPRASQSLEVISAFALGLAVVNLVFLHGKKIAQRDGTPVHSLAFFAAFIAMFLFTYFGKSAGRGGRWEVGYNFMFSNLQQSMSSAVFSTIGFFMVSAAYRSFRVRSLEAGIMMLSAIIVLLGLVPIGEVLTGWAPPSLQLPAIANKLLDLVSSSAVRGIYFGILIGAIAMSLRMWLGTDETMYRGIDAR